MSIRGHDVDPLLWGVTAFLLNYIPIIGSLFGVCIFVLVGLLSFESLWWALLPPAIYLGIHLVEGETLTPMLLARRFTLNPVLIILSLVFWFWMWGVLGAILAVPMLAILKIICDRLRPLKALGHFLEGEYSDLQRRCRADAWQYGRRGDEQDHTGRHFRSAGADRARQSAERRTWKLDHAGLRGPGVQGVARDRGHLRADLYPQGWQPVSGGILLSCLLERYC